MVQKVMGRAPKIPRLPRNFFDDAAPFKIDEVYCKLIPLTEGLVAIVDAEDYPSLAIHCWCALWQKEQNTYYASRTYGENGNKISISMHRQIKGFKHGDPRKVDHENRCTVDNRRKNLREANSAQNEHNSRKSRRNTSGFKNVTLHRPSGKYHVRVMVNGKRIHGGCFDRAPEAFEVACQLMKSHHGEFARTA
jgi:hypothetical protein